MTGVIGAAFSRTGAVFIALLVLCGFGYVSFLDIPKEATPDVDIPVAYVSVGYDGISPEDSRTASGEAAGESISDPSRVSTRCRPSPRKGMRRFRWSSTPARISIAFWTMCARRLMMPA